MRKTKIVCTLGPASSSPEMIRNLIKNGMDVVRLNFSHGSHEEHLKRINLVKEIREEENAPVGIMLDTKGPEIRVCKFQSGSVELSQGKSFTLTTKDVPGTADIVSITYKGLPKDVKAGGRILIDDGLIELKIKEVDETDILCEVVNGGIVSDNKSINVPGVKLNLPFISEKDEKDLVFGVQNDVDFIAASFTRSAYDILEMKKILEQNGGENIKIIAKIESAEGVVNIDEIIKVSDGIMVARGDMGVEIEFDKLPRIQKMLIAKCVSRGKSVITATQMLESMIKNPRPTRAEASDVANAVYDGTSAVMLSGETAAGKYPLEALKTMALIAKRTEENINYRGSLSEVTGIDGMNVTNAISHATCTTAADLDAAAIIAVTTSGHTARMVSRFKPPNNIIASTTNRKVFYQLSLTWGVIPIMGKEQDGIENLFHYAVESAKEEKLIKNGDLVVITAGAPVGVSGTTNLIKVQTVGNVLISGKGVTNLMASGTACVAKSKQDAIRNFNAGDILIIGKTDNDLLDIMKRASAIITEEDGVASHAAVVGLTRDIPVIVGAENATRLLKSGTPLTVDASVGLVYCGVVKA